MSSVFGRAWHGWFGPCRTTRWKWPEHVSWKVETAIFFSISLVKRCTISYDNHGNLEVTASWVEKKTQQDSSSVPASWDFWSQVVGWLDVFLGWNDFSEVLAIILWGRGILYTSTISSTLSVWWYDLSQFRGSILFLQLSSPSQIHQLESGIMTWIRVSSIPQQQSSRTRIGIMNHDIHQWGIINDVRQ